jgi:hypothetical protein
MDLGAVLDRSVAHHLLPSLAYNVWLRIPQEFAESFLKIVAVL